MSISSHAPSTPGSWAMAAAELQLAEVELQHLFARVPGLRSPSDIESDREPEWRQDSEETVSRVLGFCDPSPLFGIDSLLRQLRERDAYLAASGHSLVAPYELIDVTATEDDGNVVRFVAARVGENDGEGFLIPLRSPFDVRWVGLLRGLCAADRVRLLTEFVRVLGNLVRFSGFPESFQRELIGSASELVRLLRTAIRKCRSNETGETENDRRDESYPLDGPIAHKSSPVHSAPEDKASDVPVSAARSAKRESILTEAVFILANEERRLRWAGEPALQLGMGVQRINALRKRNDNIAERDARESEFVRDILTALTPLVELPQAFVEDLVDLLKCGLHQSSPVSSGPEGEASDVPVSTVPEHTDTFSGVGIAVGAGSPAPTAHIQKGGVL